MADDDGPTFPQAPPEHIDLTQGLCLVRCDPERSAAAVRAINESLEHLRPWMAWASEPATEASIGTFLAASVELWDRHRDFGYSIIDAATEDIVGGCGLHGRLGPDGLEVGYWVHVDWTGKGVATDATRALTDAAFALPGIERVRIQCEDGNARSARIPEKLGFRLQGVAIPDGGPCEGRPTQIWMVDRDDWAGGVPVAASP